ncbi:MAG: imidazole glycerol phosphate synthase subunit HisH [archaeon]|jgi:glutamine amidotransferase
MIGIIDYGAGNLKSVKNALDFLGAKSKIISTPKEVESVEGIILPGVGSFGFIMENLRSKGLDLAIVGAISKGKPYFGICLGLQILFEKSEESAGVKGLGVFKGEVVKFTKGKVPQVGWNEVNPVQKGLLDNGFAYFVNSYYVVPKKEEIILGRTDNYVNFTSAVEKDNVFAVQFHPEKSGEYGLDILRRWVDVVEKNNSLS